MGGFEDAFVVVDRFYIFMLNARYVNVHTVCFDVSSFSLIMTCTL